VLCLPPGAHCLFLRLFCRLALLLPVFLELCPAPVQEVGDPVRDAADGKPVQDKEDRDHVHLLCKLIKLCHIHLPRIFFELAGGSGDCRPVLSQER